MILLARDCTSSALAHADSAQGERSTTGDDCTYRFVEFIAHDNTSNNGNYRNADHLNTLETID